MPSDINFKPTVQTVTSQIVYKFNGGMPAPVYPTTPGDGHQLDRLLRQCRRWVWLVELRTRPPSGPRGTGYASYARRKSWAAKVIWAWSVPVMTGSLLPTWVAGVFGDVDISSLKGTIQDQTHWPYDSGSIKQTSAWAVGPRLGWLPSPQTMTYVNGGYTGARFSGADMVFRHYGATDRVLDAGIHRQWLVRRRRRGNDVRLLRHVG